MQELVEIAKRMATASAPLVDAQLAELASIPSYARIPASDLRRSAERNVARVVSVLSAEERLPDWVVEREGESGRQRAIQGVPSDDVVAAYRLALGVLRDAFLATADDVHASREAVVAGMRRLWDLTDHYSGELVAAHHELDLDLARRAERDRSSYVHNLLLGTLQHSEVLSGGASFGLRAESSYWVLRARATGGHASADGLLRALGGSQDGSTLLADVGGDVAGVAAARPVAPGGVVIGVSGPVPLGSAHPAFVAATRLLDVALMFGLDGFVDRERLSVRAAVADSEEIGEMLVRRLVDPVAEQTSIAGEVLGSVRSFLRHRRSYPEAARSLAIHPNTLRYRIELFENATGADLRDTESLVEVWWALEHWRLRHP